MSGTAAVLSSPTLCCLVRSFGGSCWASGCLSQLLNNRFRVEIACLGNLTRVASGVAGLCMFEMRKMSDLVQTEDLVTGCKKIEGIEWVHGTPLQPHFDRTLLWAVSVFLCGESGFVSAKGRERVVVRNCLRKEESRKLILYPNMDELGDKTLLEGETSARSSSATQAGRCDYNKRSQNATQHGILWFLFLC